MTFYTGNNNIFYLELAMDRTEFIKVVDFEPQERPDPDALMAQANASAPPQRLNRPAARTPTNCSSPWACRPRPPLRGQNPDACGCIRRLRETISLTCR